jgi:hypothetical protein
MPELVGKAPEQLTQADTTCLVHVAAAASEYLNQGNTTKAARILSDITNHFSVAGASTDTGSGETEAQASTSCTTCAALLPNEAAYLACMLSCTA